MTPPLALPTSAEIDRRLKIVSELRNLCLSLGRARRTGASPVVRQGGKPEAGAEPERDPAASVD